MEITGNLNVKVLKKFGEFDKLEMLVLQSTAKQSSFFGEQAGKDPVPRMT